MAPRPAGPLAGGPRCAPAPPSPSAAPAAPPRAPTCSLDMPSGGSASTRAAAGPLAPLPFLPPPPPFFSAAFFLGACRSGEERRGGSPCPVSPPAPREGPPPSPFGMSARPPDGPAAGGEGAGAAPRPARPRRPRGQRGGPHHDAAGQRRSAAASPGNRRPNLARSAGRAAAPDDRPGNGAGPPWLPRSLAGWAEGRRRPRPGLGPDTPVPALEGAPLGKCPQSGISTSPTLCLTRRGHSCPCTECHLACNDGARFERWAAPAPPLPGPGSGPAAGAAKPRGHRLLPGGLGAFEQRLLRGAG